jgi:tRNA nucleotidyltransferase (CCA-adding enzyme)
MRIFEVGGSIRDEILGLKNKDRDFCVEAESFDAMRDGILALGGVIFLEKPEFTTIRAKMGKDDIRDFVLCRKDGAYSDGRHPDTIEAGTLLDDLARRDFTMNAIAKDSDGNLVDPFGGAEDIKAGVIRCVGIARDRMNEDALRMLRALRFSIVKGMMIDGEILALFDDDGILGLIENSISVERIREELHKMFARDSFASIMLLARFPRLLKILVSRGLWLEPTMRKA